jgi:hypothetical protein
MVRYLFGSKAELFRAALRLIIDPDVLVAAMNGDEGTSAAAWRRSICKSGNRQKPAHHGRHVAVGDVQR